MFQNSATTVHGAPRRFRGSEDWKRPGTRTSLQKYRVGGRSLQSIRFSPEILGHVQKRCFRRTATVARRVFMLSAVAGRSENIVICRKSLPTPSHPCHTSIPENSCMSISAISRTALIYRIENFCRVGATSLLRSEQHRFAKAPFSWNFCTGFLLRGQKYFHTEHRIIRPFSSITFPNATRSPGRAESSRPQTKQKFFCTIHGSLVV